MKGLKDQLREWKKAIESREKRKLKETKREVKHS